MKPHTKLNRKNINRDLIRNNLYISDESEYTGMYQPRKNIHFKVKDTETKEVLGDFKTLKEAYEFVKPINEERNNKRIQKLEDEKPEVRYFNALLNIKSLASNPEEDLAAVLKNIIALVDKATVD